MPSKIIFFLQATVFLLSTACLKTINPPPLSGFPFPQPFRDWRSIHVCEVDETLIEDELARFNTFADAFLEDTSEKTKLPKKKRVDSLKLAPQIKPLLDGFGNLIFQSPSCAFSKNTRMTSLVRRSAGLLSLSRQRLEQAPALIKLLEEGWEDSTIEKDFIKKAFEEWCPPPGQRSPVPDIYYVSENETLRKRWLFCDGAEMIAEPGKELSLTFPNNPPRNSRSYPRGLYREVAESYPDSQIRRPPKSNNSPKGKTP